MKISSAKMDEASLRERWQQRFEEKKPVGIGRSNNDHKIDYKQLGSAERQRTADHVRVSRRAVEKLT